MNPRFVWPAVVLVGVAMIVTAVMAIAGVDRETIVVVISLMVSPVLTAMLAIQVAEVRSTTNQVAHQTNGTNTRMMEIIEAQGRLLAAMSPAPATAPAPPQDPA
ncbi:hypothetical protein [Phytohabitans rumicis]|uniref:Uncharacterized protein n=1 Tax=Phytohabitans rumicis TaxID=1076125 RepID=A0A6V8LA52_9ACTN|nr:hypothetical protein [Phytohabitans rumicis]GFJ92490.1 hypothetical protein Prum_061320 [Phytohabitans rumicis]